MDRQGNPPYDSIESDLNLWKNRIIKLEAEVHQLKAKRCIELVNKDEIKVPAKKKSRMQENMDPFNYKFPPHCIELVMSHFEGEDLYKMSKVSSHWKQMLERNKHTAEKLKNFLTLSLYRPKELVEILGQDINVEYAHMHVDFHSKERELNLLLAACLIRFSPYIETLWIDDSDVFRDYDGPSVGLTFPRLKTLRIGCTNFGLGDWICSSQFPVLQSLRCENCTIFTSFDVLKALLKPTLRELVIFEVELSKFLNQLINLESLEIVNFDNRETDLILKNMKKLKSLTLSIYYHGNVNDINWPLTENTSITFLELKRPIHEFELRLLKALPSLRTLFLRSTCYDGNFDQGVVLSRKLLNWIVRYNLKLKTIKCQSIDDNLLEEYERLKKCTVDNPQINTNIEILVIGKNCNSYWF